MASVHHVRDIVASNIKRLRKERGITQAQLAEMTDLSNTYIANIECGKTWISDKTLERLAAAFETEFQVFFSVTGTAQENESYSIPLSIQKQLLQLHTNNNQLLTFLENNIKHLCKQ